MKVIFLILISFTFIGCQNSPSKTSPGELRSASKVIDLHLDIVVAEDPEFIKDWTSTPSTHAPSIKGIHKINPNQTVHAAFIVSGFKGNSNGIFDVNVSWALINPDGSEMFEQKNYARASGKMPERPSYAMADPALDFGLEDSDPKGKYILRGTANDVTTGKSVEKEYEISFGE